MNLKILGILLGISVILIAIWNFDRNSWNQIIISTLLFSSGLITLLTDSESKFLQEARGILLYVAGIIVIFLIFKVLFVG